MKRWTLANGWNHYWAVYWLPNRLTTVNNEHRQVRSASFNEKLVPVFRSFKTVRLANEDFRWPAFESIQTASRGSTFLLFQIWRCFNWRIQRDCRHASKLFVPMSDLLCPNVKETMNGSRLIITDSNRLLTFKHCEQSKAIIQASYLLKIQQRKALLRRNVI